MKTLNWDFRNAYLPKRTHFYFLFFSFLTLKRNSNAKWNIIPTSHLKLGCPKSVKTNLSLHVQSIYTSRLIVFGPVKKGGLVISRKKIKLYWFDSDRCSCFQKYFHIDPIFWVQIWLWIHWAWFTFSSG